ncbi:hypothetical protein OIU84_005114 [Salix udensis]|uniref:Uncharacterized protein n=1 Tax=Salix udensis TaxID=889485 RepID=A0AAD6JXK7_9ROSI|nr:hypothetical protein OIU84_005114 [Salix udensis]
MAVQAQLYPERIGVLPMCGIQDCLLNNPVSGLEPDLGFVFQDTPQQNLFLEHHNSQNFGFDCNIGGGGGGGGSSSSTTRDSSLSMSLSQYLDVQLDMQRREVDYMLQFQAGRLRYAFATAKEAPAWNHTQKCRIKATRSNRSEEDWPWPAMKSQMQNPFAAAHVIENRIKKAKKRWSVEGAILGARALSFSHAGTSARASPVKLILSPVLSVNL